MFAVLVPWKAHTADKGGGASARDDTTHSMMTTACSPAPRVPSHLKHLNTLSMHVGWPARVHGYGAGERVHGQCVDGDRRQPGLVLGRLADLISAIQCYAECPYIV